MAFGGSRSIVKSPFPVKPDVITPARIAMKNLAAKGRIRFSVRSLLLFTAASAVFLACFLQLSSAYRQSRDASNVLRAAGGSVSWTSDSFFRNATFPSICIVDLQNCKLTDREYAALASIPDYFVLMIDSKIFDRHAMTNLANTEYLSGLHLEPGPVSEEAVFDFQNRRPDIMVTVGLTYPSMYREYPRSTDEAGAIKR